MAITKRKYMTFLVALLAIALVLTFCMTAFTAYTAWIGIRLAYCTFIVIEAESNMGREMIDEAYNEAMRIRNAVASECAYSRFICKTHITIKCLAFFAEFAVTCVMIAFDIFLIKRIIAEVKRVIMRRKKSQKKGR